MLVNIGEEAKGRPFNKQWWVALVCALAIGAEVLYFLKRGAASFQLGAPGTPAPGGPGNVEQIADSLFHQYLLPFEIASVLLLAAVIGSVIMAKKRV
jgi:NADH-quinone oxidoreductase subunit J